jgi:hypothetical protein
MAQLVEKCRILHQICDKSKQVFIVPGRLLQYTLWFSNRSCSVSPHIAVTIFMMNVTPNRFFFAFVAAICHVTWALGFSSPHSFVLYLRYFCCRGLRLLLAVLLKVQMLWDVARYVSFQQLDLKNIASHCTSHAITYFRRVRKTAKTTISFVVSVCSSFCLAVCLPVCVSTHGITWPPPHGF